MVTIQIPLDEKEHKKVVDFSKSWGGMAYYEVIKKMIRDFQEVKHESN